MGKNINRRDFVRVGAAVGITAAAKPLFGRAPAVQTNPAKPLVISSGRGTSRDEEGLNTVEKAFKMITDGEDVLDAVVAGVTIVDRDPNAGGVGYGGTPNADGVVQLDSCCMHGPLKRAGGVAALEGVKECAMVGQAVLENTDHHLLVGKGAQTFARNMGFEVLDDLNTEQSRRRWLEWKRRTDPGHYLDPDERAARDYEAGLQMVREGLIPADEYWGTINCDGINAAGDICGVTTTSGLAFKIPGRAGDSPILGAGLYLDNDIGAAGSTGRGEANLYNLTSYLIIENMRRGMHPKDAGMEGLKRIKSNTIERRLLNSRGEPAFGINFYILNKNGEHAGVGMYAGANSRYSICTENGFELVPIEPLLSGSATN